MRATLTAATAAIFAVLAFSAGLSAADDPMMGAWKLVPSKSKLTPDRQRNIVRKHEPIPGGMKVSWTGVDDKGKPTDWGFSAKFDGKYYPSTAEAFDEVALKRVDPNTVEGTSKKNGQQAVTFRWVVSKDGKTLTRSTTRVNPPEQAGTTTEVFEKQ
ncbi:MAG: hypothetical protein A3J28_09115 [Acidobacteria bacterium RIFCSPLOWO2_12_FULL_60_22]|nr:MAG: hypothetical protein A3J28_09115 [Acidobacteria bacterium RIFCSPLOWO2_12_FULL_60_22]